jgi:hypothetical protein
VNHTLEEYYRIPVFCCWNGLAIVSTRPFYDYEYRWRFGQQDYENGECASGEIGYLCEDFWALYGNRTRIYLIPSVHVAYDWKTYRAIEKASWFKKSLAKQNEFQNELKIRPIIDPPETMCVPHQWQCVSVQNAPIHPLRYSWKNVNMLAEYEKVSFIRQVLTYKNEWRQSTISKHGIA